MEVDEPSRRYRKLGHPARRHTAVEDQRGVGPALVDKGIPTIVTGFATPESSIHSPNERLLAEYLPLGIETAKELYRSLAALEV